MLKLQKEHASAETSPYTEKTETKDKKESETTADTKPAETAGIQTETMPESMEQTEETAESASETISEETVPSETADTETTEQETQEPLHVSNLTASAISVNCLKVTWDAIDGYDYEVSVNTNAPYSENMYFHFKEKNLLYLTALREDSEYEISVVPMTETEAVQPETVVGHTEKVTVVYDFDQDEEAYSQYRDSGTLYATNFFAGERASGLTAQPASGAIAGSICDPVTGTGICRDEYGDYCAALGAFFGHDWDRYLVTFQNGQQITVKQCDDKGAKWYHTVGGNDLNRNLVEFIWSGSRAPDCVMYAGTWGDFNWNGLILDHIASIQKIEYPEKPIAY